MKKPIFVFSVATLLCAWTCMPVRAEEGTEKSQKPPKPSHFAGEGMRDKLRERFMENLSPENRQRFDAAREKAMQDPALQELRKLADKANRDFFKGVRDKMLEIDPGLADIVKNNFSAPPGKGPKKEDNSATASDMSNSPALEKPSEGRGRGWRSHGNAPGLAEMTESERAQYMAARETAKNDPAVVAAETKKKEADTPEARQSASEEYRKAMTAAILKADPSLAPLIEKMSPPAASKEGTKNNTADGATMAPSMQME